MFVKRLIYRRPSLQPLIRHCSQANSTLNSQANSASEPTFDDDEDQKPPQKLKYRPQVKAVIDAKLTEDLSSKTIVARKHPGANQLKATLLPEHIAATFEKVIGDHPPKQLTKDAVFLDNYLKARHAPAEQHEIRSRMKAIQLEVEQKFNIDTSQLSEDDFRRYQKNVDAETKKILKSRVFAWKALEFDEYRSRMYLFARSAADYAAINACLKEIIRRDPNFRPASFFDFGSGVGTGTWAASNYWKNTIYEYFNVDSSGPMNDLAELILKGGDENKKISLKNVFYRQFLGAPTTSYDLVLSAFSLIELPNRKARLETLANLWARCSGYLVLIELGTNTGFKLIHEARSFITSLRDDDEQGEGYLFAPCPQEGLCPRFEDENDKSPCNFEVKYFPLPFFNQNEPRKDKFSYVIFKKNGKREDDPAVAWPRCVRPTIAKPRHTFCRICTKEGCLQEVVFTPGKHGKQAYQLGKRSRWGDQLPMELEVVQKDENKE
ncbi:methyltransferase-like protein 17, mitochondrial [Culicoides brevitarsis]|uniref:methyltransferase-like protein 17, mitochondrial n=1 Tax=Culicoides brevitarsis TaxID=469753 RepID=UPI00307B86B9